MQAALDQLGIPQDDESMQPVEEPEETIEEVEEVEEVEDLPGFISYEDWIADGRNPDDWQGKNKYEQQYNLIQDNKGIRSELRNLNDMLQHTVEATNSIREKAYNEGMAEAQADLNQALADNDAEGVNQARDKMASLEAPPQVPALHPLHREFFHSNPILDQNSDQFDAEIMQEFVRIHDGQLRRDGVTPKTQLTEAAMRGYMRDSLQSAKSLFPDKFESKRNTQPTTTTPPKRRAKPKTDPAANVKNVRVERSNKRDTTPVMDLYNEILNGPGGKEAADAFAAKMGV